MKITDIKNIEHYIKSNKYRSVWRKMVKAMACVVIFCTTYALILPAITMTQDYICGMEQHIHTDECLAEVQTTQFACQTDGGYAHIHENLCFDEQGALICPLEEAEPHIHSDGCYTVAGHSHKEDCSDAEGSMVCTLLSDEKQLVCTLQELSQHIHTEQCVTKSVDKVLGCGKEEHTHDDSCLPQPAESQPVPEATPEMQDGTATQVTGENTVSENYSSVQSNGVMTAAEAAVLTLNLYSWNEWNPITLPQGNTYNCEVGSTVTIVLGASGANYAEPVLTLTGAELVSASYSCEDSSHTDTHGGWCQPNPCHTIVVKITSPDARVEGQISGTAWNNNSVTVSASGSTEPTPTATPTATPAATATPTPTPSIEYPYYPQGVVTGSIEIARLRMYNLCENGESGVSALEGCVFEIKGVTNSYTAIITSGNTPEVNLPSDIPDGTYTITEISVPEGYLRDTDYERTFVIKNGMQDSSGTIGTFINHNLEQLTDSKLAEVEDYNNRIYEVMLTAESHMRHYQMDPIDLLIAVDKSNSMLFPSGLTPTGKSVTLTLSGDGNINSIESQNLDKSKLYYVISDPAGSSTVWAVWYNGRNWLYQDASYYAKAQNNNAAGYKDPNETAIFPDNLSYQQQADTQASGTRANGGGLGFSLSGSGLGKDIDKEANDTKTYQIYTATDGYNRLHYMEEALSNIIYQLSDINHENRVTLVTFTKEIGEDIGPLVLSPDNTEYLVSQIRSINTSGGTRQDIALKHLYNAHLNNAGDNYNSDSRYNYSLLITDGAPALSSGSDIDNLGSASDAASTTANSVYAQIKGWAQQVKNRSSLMTVGLGMDNVEAGKAVLEEIATNDEFYCALDDASKLVENITKIVFDGFRPQNAIHMTGDVVDEISNSFYPVAWTEHGYSAQTGRTVLINDGAKDWVLLQTGDWITEEGRYTTAGAQDAAGQLLQKADGTFYFLWEDVPLSDPYIDDVQRIAWVTAGTGAATGRTVVATENGKDWILLNEGDWIDTSGQYYQGTPSYWNRRYYGQIAGDGETYYVSWGSSANGGSRQLYSINHGWQGSFYLKAKEDFIGGNAIYTNKDAYITIDNADKHFVNPTVNVHLLDMNHMESETTVFLGDMVNSDGHSPDDSMWGFYAETEFTKLISCSGTVMNKTDVNPGTGLSEAVFSLKYPLGSDFTEQQWAALRNGQTINMPYVYDNNSSHGPVGYFTFALEKTGIAGANPQWDVHTADAACQPQGSPLTENCTSAAETYILHITYTAYRLGESGRPAQNVYNGTAGAGTEVGTGATTETGLGTIVKQNIHKVHVISGAVKVTKSFEDGLVSDKDNTFTFMLHRQEDGDDTSQDMQGTITIPAGANKGETSLIFDGLRRGTYTVTEAPHDAYMPLEMQVADTTNCFSVPAAGQTAQTVTFKMGSNTKDMSVTGYISPSDIYTSYIDTVNGVFGEVHFTNTEIVWTGQLPVTKYWDDGADTHYTDSVYVALYLDGTLYTDADGRAQLLKLDSHNNWQGAFTITLDSAEDRVENYSYSVKEVSAVSSDPLHEWHKALLVNDGTTVVYFEKALEDGDQLGVNGKGYMVKYKTDTGGGWIVENHHTVILPQTGWWL